MAAAIVMFVLRPSGEAVAPAAAAPVIATVPHEPSGTLTCALIPERSRVVSTSTAPVALAWSTGGCANGREPFADAAGPNGGRWERLDVPDDEQTVTLRSFDPVTRTYAATRWFLDAEAMAAARRRRDPGPEACGADPAAAARRAQAASAIRTQLPPLPNEKLVYSCTAAR